MKPRIESENAASEELLNQVRQGFVQRGESIAAWSRERGFDPDAVYQVLSGRTLALRGKSHHIAVALGIKAAPQQPTEPARPDAAKEKHM